MGTLESKFTRVDLDTLIEAMGDWETMGNHDFHVLGIIKNMPMPAEDHEAFEYIKEIKDHFLKREREINDSRMLRQERAILLKAKLILVRSDMGVSQLFEMAGDPSDKGVSAPKETPAPAAPASVKELADLKKKLERAEFFIRDLGTWTHYEKFLTDKAE